MNPLHAEEDLNCLPERPNGQPKNQLLTAFVRSASASVFAEREQRFEELIEHGQLREWQQQLRATFARNLGGFPDRTPLNAQTVAVIEGDDYRIEKVIYESRPNFHVTALLYLPRSQAPFPAVLLPCGHSPNGKAAGAYQRAARILVSHGMAVLCYDPIGQGERKQILKTNEQGERTPAGEFGATQEHTICGIAPILLGQSLASYRIWDGMRGIDYLHSRPDIDRDRIGCTGNSGGGLMTSYLVSLDERIAAAAPGCFITTTRRKNISPGPGDAEQNYFRQITDGPDHADYIMMAAPRPVLICSATQDFVPIEGTWESFRQAKRFYTQLGFPERVDLVETNAKHGFSQPLRQGVAQWMQRWLRGVDEPVVETPVETHSDEQLQCTPAGQVLLLEGERSVLDLFQQRLAVSAPNRMRWRQLEVDERRDEIRQLIALRSTADDFQPAPADRRADPRTRIQNTGYIDRRSYRIERLVLRSVDGFPVPGLLFATARPAKYATLYLHSQGKHVDAGPDGPIASLVADGHMVLAVDLRGYGETQSSAWRFSASHAGINAAEFFIAYMQGQSLVGMRTDDVLIARNTLAQLWGRANRVQLLAEGSTGIPALHAAALHPDLFSSVQVRNSLHSWTSLFESLETRDQLESVVHGALSAYDLPDLVPLIGSDRITIERPVDAMGRPVAR